MRVFFASVMLVCLVIAGVFDDALRSNERHQARSDRHISTGIVSAATPGCHWFRGTAAPTVDRDGAGRPIRPRSVGLQDARTAGHPLARRPEETDESAGRSVV